MTSDPASRAAGALRRASHGLVVTSHPAVLPAVRKPLAITAVLAALVVTVLAVRDTGDTAASGLDRLVQDSVVDPLALPERGALLIDLVGAPVVAVGLAVLLAAVCLILGRGRLAVVALVGLLLTGVLTTLLKPVIDRTIHGGHLSYPSGHTAAATVLAFVAALLLVDLLPVGRWLGLLLIVVVVATAATTMAWAQVSLHAHYPTDTVGGFCTAVVVVSATAFLIDWCVARHGNGPPEPRTLSEGPGQ